MDLFTALISGVGLATSIFGAGEQFDSARKQQAAQTEIANNNAQITATQQQVADINYGTSVKTSSIAFKQEKLRQQQSIQQAQLMQRELVRQSQLAEATAVSGAVEGGGLYSTGLQGVKGQIAQETGEQGTTLFANTQRALQNFQFNRSTYLINKAANATISGLNKKIAGYQTQNNYLSAKANNAEAQGKFGATLFQSGLTIAGAAKDTSSVVKSLYGYATNGEPS